jgi:CheY-like chemotaxis protein
VPVERASIRLQDIFDRLHDQFHEIAAKKGIELHLRPTRLVVRSDPVLLARILSNLVANAIKYTPHGRVLVGCRRRNALIEIQVHDTGVGIASRHHKAIFDEFVQLDNTARNREQGLGLGLSIVDRTARLLQHPLRMQSTPGSGSMFAVSVPLARHQVAIETHAAPVPVRHHTGVIIVVDDDLSAREALVDLLDVHGYEVIAVPGIAQARSRLAGQHITASMIIADYRLGGDTTGVEAIRAIQPLLASPAPAIIITGDTSPDRIREASASGFPLLHKPLEPAALLAALHANQQ